MSDSLSGFAGGGLLGYASARQSAKESAFAAQQSRDWMERMSDTAYQRAAKDLEAAGLNRILAIGSPATTPSSAAAQVPDYASAISKGVGSAAQVRKVTADVRNTEAIAEQNETQAEIDKASLEMINKYPRIRESAAGANITKKVGLSGAPGGVVGLGSSMKEVVDDFVGSSAKSVSGFIDKGKAKVKSFIDKRKEDKARKEWLKKKGLKDEGVNRTYYKYRNMYKQKGG